MTQLRTFYPCVSQRGKLHANRSVWKSKTNFTLFPMTWRNPPQAVSPEVTPAVTPAGWDGAQQHPRQHSPAETTLQLLLEHYRQKLGGFTQTLSILVSSSF